MSNFIDITGQRFGRLTVIKFVGMGNYHMSLWLCKCDCGKEIIKPKNNLMYSKNLIKSCGCYTKEFSKNNIQETNKKRIMSDDKHATINKIFTDYTQSCKVYNKDFYLTKEDLENLIFSNCHYCGAEPTLIQKHRRGKTVNYLPSNGIDRIDSSKGYTLDNVVPCCKWCNYSKRERKVDDFKEWADRLYHNLHKEDQDA
jgi:hypothetical protein